MKSFLLAMLFGLSACGQSMIDELNAETVDLKIENRTSENLYYFAYADCGANNWIHVIDDDKFVASFDDITERFLDPGCYDLYVETESGCWAENSTDQNVDPGFIFTWTITDDSMNCSVWDEIF